MSICVPFGLLLGYRGGWWDRLGSSLIDVSDALPGILLGFAMIAVLGWGLFNLMMAIGLIFCMGLARTTRAVALAERQKLYVDAARVAGLRTPEILFRQVLPNLAGATVAQASVFLAAAIMVESAPSFLGIGLEDGNLAEPDVLAGFGKRSQLMSAASSRSQQGRDREGSLGQASILRYSADDARSCEPVRCDARWPDDRAGRQYQVRSVTPRQCRLYGVALRRGSAHLHLVDQAVDYQAMWSPPRAARTPNCSRRSRSIPVRSFGCPGLVRR